jgi:hypothetical protein
MILWRLLPVVGAAALAIAPAAAQEPGGAAPPVAAPDGRGSLTVISRPPGALIRAEGPVGLVGRTPWTLARGLRGAFEVTATLNGYETWKRTVFLDGATADTLSFRLRAKSAIQAAWRSTLVPGWGQHYSGKRGRGSIFLLGSLGSVAWVVVNEVRYRNRIDDVEDAWAAYADEDRYPEKQLLWDRVERERERAENAYDARTVALVVLGTVYAWNVFDALFLFPQPSPGDFAGVQDRPGLFAAAGSRGLSVGVRVAY